jgi:serine protease Do
MTSLFTAHDLTACTYEQPMSSDGGFIHRLDAGSCVGANGQPLDLYSFTLDADATVAAFMTSSDVNGFLTLADAAGNALRSDRNSYDGARDPMIVQYLPAGTYRLAARAAGSGEAGLYQVDVRNTPGLRPPLCAARSTVALGATVSGTIGYNGCQYTGGTFADIYRIRLDGSTTVDLRLTSGDFDAYLYLLDAKGNVVDQDDDSGGNTDARIARLLGAGEYYVVVTPVGGYTQGGGYQLSVGQAQ